MKRGIINTQILKLKMGNSLMCFGVIRILLQKKIFCIRKKCAIYLQISNL